MIKHLCLRCGDRYAQRWGGHIEMKHGSMGIDAHICGECYDELVETYRNPEADTDAN